MLEIYVSTDVETDGPVAVGIPFSVLDRPPIRRKRKCFGFARLGHHADGERPALLIGADHHRQRGDRCQCAQLGEHRRLLLLALQCCPTH